MTDKIVTEHGRLGFVDGVVEHFAFLIKFGFRIVDTQPTLVTFAGQGCSLNVYFGRRSYELGVVLKREGEEFHLAEFIRLADPNRAKSYRNFQTSRADGVAKGLASLVDLVREFIIPALQADQSSFERLRLERIEWSNNYAMQVLADQVRPLAGAAFRRGDYTTAQKLYGRIASVLSPAEQARYSLASKRSKNSRRAVPCR